MKRKILTAVFGLAALAAFTFSPSLTPSSEAGNRMGKRKLKKVWFKNAYYWTCKGKGNECYK